MGEQGVKHLFRPFETQICPADHQQGRNRAGGKAGQQQGQRKQNDDLVEQRPFGDAPDDRQFALCLKTRHIFGCDGRVVNDHACGLGAGLGRRPGDIVNRGGGDFCNRRHIIQ